MSVSKFKNVIIMIAVTVMVAAITIGCSEKHTTVADNIKDATSADDYIEIGHFQVKSSEKNDNEEIDYCAIMIPEGYHKIEGNNGMYVSDIYPLDASNVYYTIQELSEGGTVSDDLNRDDYKQTVENAYSEMGKNISLIIDDFQKEDMQGVPVYRIRSHYSYENNEVQQLAYIIKAKQTHVITYTQLNDDDLFADFETFEGNIRLVRKASY
ncbi:MAG: hypothetical protein MJ133_04345 [Lachnospiraceae bacterium]|nr:hypothetical protein [Lachnospiraceae bacterium]